MTFFPDGETHIPHQTPIPEVSDGSPLPPREASPWGAPPAPPAVDDRQQFARVLIRTAVINGGLFVAAIMLAYVVPITDDSTVATAIIVAAVIIASVHMTVVVMAQKRRRQAAEANGGQPSAVQSSTIQPAASQPGAVPPGAPAPAGTFSLTVEDVFTITGRGLVVAGVVESGALHPGETVSLVRNGEALMDVQVAGIEIIRRAARQASAGESVGLLLRGIEDGDVQRGDVLTR